MTMPHIRMYATGTCPYCHRAEHLLRSKGVGDELELIRVDIDPSRRAEMMQLSGRRTVPQIFIGDYHVGGCDDLHDLDHRGGLDPLLQGQGA
ncbi:glutaredoxin 3 [Azoarcus sp. TTM-91]|uniref:glutaredoxin 3 n=1 Tax=Azoarcus sp. TTM-91 TaxID=2691581 RepID=UPI002006DD36|nr:glutaredoxin 3 [Azoarcus sp. TTM-91]